MREEAPTRARVAARFEKAFKERAAQLNVGVDLDHAEMGKHLEICARNHVIRDAPPDMPLLWEAPAFRYRYTTRCLSLEHNLRNESNPGLAMRILKRETGLKEFARMHPYAMHPGLWAPVFERVARRQMQKIFPLDSSAAYDGAVQCKRCKSKKTTFTLLQTRAADEPMTAFYYCYSCTFRWRGS